ncbi:MAG TPA: hypothetical protein VHG71_08490 [Verrucomicrobiae bacterium]|nr:hypothetical protein [Verrucomicrobiae bacterium]
MKNVAFKIVMLAMVSLFLSGCGKSSNKYLDELKNYKQPPDTDVTQSPEYNFSPLAGTVWQTKAKTALVDVTRYTNEHAIDLVPPETFEPTDLKYKPIAGMQIISVLPIGTCLRIERLMKDNGEWGGVRVMATIFNETYSNKVIYLDPRLLEFNQFTRGGSTSTNRDINPDMLEAVTNAP